MSSERWTPDRIPDLHGRTALVTGANSGIGLHTAMELARHGAHVVMTARDPHRGDEALGQVRVQVPGASVELVRLDLAELASVRTAAAQVLAAHPRLEVLVDNAGVMALPKRILSADGFEMQMATNHLGHFALTGLLLPALVAGSARVVSVSSNAHRMGRLNLDDLNSERGYSPWPAYGQSKLANLLFTMELQRRADRAALDLTAVAAHPGLAATNLVLAGPGHGRGPLGRIADAATRLVGQPAQMGAWPSLYAATMPDVQGTEYFGPHAFGGWRGYPERTTAAPAAYDPDVAAALWQRSVELTGVGFDALT
ncbi:MAG TPA: oxidoreductase [Actinomycetales bacterium]|jgi:NAD(P)-dependent dehydrogenase (short-subunit alcohol dehydrogenase family)